MEQTEIRTRLIKYLLEERNETISIPSDEGSQKRLLRALLKPADARFCGISIIARRISDRKKIRTRNSGR